MTQSIEIMRSSAALDSADKATLEPFTLGGQQVQIATYRPGWRWSEDVKPSAHTDSCQLEHLAYVASGHMHVVNEDGSDADLLPGDIVHLLPGHDAWVVGDEPAVWFHVLGAAPTS